MAILTFIIIILTLLTITIIAINMTKSSRTSKIVFGVFTAIFMTIFAIFLKWIYVDHDDDGRFINKYYGLILSYSVFYLFFHFATSNKPIRVLDMVACVSIVILIIISLWEFKFFKYISG